MGAYASLIENHCCKDSTTEVHQITEASFGIGEVRAYLDVILEKIKQVNPDKYVGMKNACYSN